MEMVVKIFISLVVITLSNAGDEDNLMNHLRSKRTIGRAHTPIIHVPHHVSIELNGVHHCGGSIITVTWIITVAHCIYMPKEYYRIRAGSTFTRLGGSIHTIQAVINHPNFIIENGHAYNDIALINVNELFNFDQFCQPINLIDYHEITPVGTIGFLNGLNKPEGVKTFENTKSAKLKIISKRKCNALYREEFVLPKNQFCAQLFGSRQSGCSGDSGSSFVINNRLYGMLTWGIGCGSREFPDVFIKIAPYRPWLDSIVETSYSPKTYSNDYRLMYRNTIPLLLSCCTNICQYEIVNDIKLINCYT